MKECPACGCYDTFFKLDQAQLAGAVIEAAKALHAAMIQSYDGEPVPLAVMVEFKTAVEALQEVEGE